MKLYVGNLPWSVDNSQLEELFSEFGSVISANVITDRDSKRSRGFGFVELESGGPEAIEAMNDSDLEGRKLTVNEAKPRTNNSLFGAPARNRTWSCHLGGGRFIRLNYKG